MTENYKFSPVEMYGDRTVFEEMVGRGYEEVAFGGGPWVKDQRIVALFAFYHPDGMIATLEHAKFQDGAHTSRSPPFQGTYTKKQFEIRVNDFQIGLGARSGLTELLQEWKNE